MPPPKTMPVCTQPRHDMSHYASCGSFPFQIRCRMVAKSRLRREHRSLRVIPRNVGLPISLVRFCGSSLTEISFVAEEYYERANDRDHHAFAHILNILSSQRPQICSIHFCGLPFYFSRFHASLSLFLQCIQNTLEHITLGHSDELNNFLAQSNFPLLVSIELIYHPSDRIAGILQIIRHVARESPHFSRLSLSQLCNYVDDTPLPPLNIPCELVQLMQELKLQSLHLDGCQIPLDALNSIISHPTLNDLQLRGCAGDSQGMKVLLGRPSLVSRVENWHGFTSEDLECLAGFTRLEHLFIRLSTGLLPDVAEYLPRFQVLSDLTLTLLDEELSVEYEELLLSTIRRCHPLRRLGIFRASSVDDEHRKGLSAHSIKQLLISQASAGTSRH